MKDEVKYCNQTLRGIFIKRVAIIFIATRKGKEEGNGISIRRKSVKMKDGRRIL